MVLNKLKPKTVDTKMVKQRKKSAMVKGLKNVPRTREKSMLQRPPGLKRMRKPKCSVKRGLFVYQQESNFVFPFHTRVIISFLIPFLSVTCGPSGSHKLFPSIRKIPLSQRATSHPISLNSGNA